MPRPSFRLHKELRGEGGDRPLFVHSQHHGARNSGGVHGDVLGVGRASEWERRGGNGYQRGALAQDVLEHAGEVRANCLEFVCEIDPMLARSWLSPKARVHLYNRKDYPS